MSEGRYLIVAAALLLGPICLAQAEERSLDRDYLPNVREAARRLTHEVEILQEDIVADVGGQKERTLYRLGDEVLAILEDRARESAEEKPQGLLLSFAVGERDHHHVWHPLGNVTSAVF